MQLFEALIHLFHPRRSNNHRAKILHASSYFSLSFIAIGVTALILQYGVLNAVLGGVLGYASDITVDQVVSATNVERSRVGLSALKLNDALSAAAQMKAQDMFTQQYWAHTSPTGTEPWFFFKKVGYEYQSAGENLARDFMNTPEMMAAWMNSPTHKANIVHAKYEEIGVAVVNGTLQGVETTLVVQLFGKQKNTPAAISAAGASAEDVAPAQKQTGSSAATMVQPAVLADTTSLADFNPPIVSPLQLMKALFAAVIGILIATLAYDAYVMEKRNISRLVGRNVAHILFLFMVVLLVLWVKGGVLLTGIGI